ncbi:MAG TPA: class 1 fructose-bisphosphatase [Chitinophagaceae bacterium]|nr:class 1 fructose-bisphosphatase [Chitinophagaceae bacterium]
MNINRTVLTLDEFRFSEVRNFPAATSELSSLLRDLALAAKLINLEVNKAGLVDILGKTGTVNVQGEEVKKLDMFANHQMISVLRRGISCAGVISEELEKPLIFDDKLSCNSNYIVAFDPLDGSSNIEYSISIGTIFGIYLRKTPAGKPCSKEDFEIEGKNIVAAGYVIYGSSTLFVFATGRGVNGFTLDPSIGEFFLSHPNINCPRNGKIVSVNFANLYNYSPGVQQYLGHCMQKNKQKEGSVGQRHVGSMVADLHRNLLQGGIFINPATKTYPDGKLRLNYECNPLAFIFEQAGGKAINETGRILEIKSKDIHQRTPLFIGSSSMVSELEEYLKKEKLIHIS